MTSATDNRVTTATPRGTRTASGYFYAGQFEIVNADDVLTTYYAVAHTYNDGAIDTWATESAPTIYTPTESWHAPIDAPEMVCPFDAAMLAYVVATERAKTEFWIEQTRAERRANVARRDRDEAYRQRDTFATLRDEAIAANAEQFEAGQASAWETFNTIGLQVATAKGYCSEYEAVGNAIAEATGMEFLGRERDYNVAVDVTLSNEYGDEIGTTRVYVGVTARSENEAKRLVTAEHVREQLTARYTFEATDAERD